MKYSPLRTLFICLFLGPVVLLAQQDAMFTKYMFNTLVYNPAYAGSHDHLSINALHRGQWWGIDGAPTTQTLSVHSPVNDRVGLGLSLVNDEIGPTGSTQVNAVYAYRIPLGVGKLSIGLQAGVFQWRADWSQLNFFDPQSQDPAYREMQPTRWMPNFGAGLYYQSPKFFIGFSSPHLVNYDLRKKDATEPDDLPAAQIYRHYYAFTGGAIPLNGDALIFRPTLLIKNVGLFGDAKNARGRIAAPTEFDLDLALLFSQKIWLGVSYRSALQAIDGTSSVDSGDIWAGLNLRNGFRIGAAYDYTLTDLQSFAGGSYELMLGYDFSYEVDRIITPRYF